MGKTTGLGMKLVVGSQDLSGDVGAIDSISSPRNMHQVPGLDDMAQARLKLRADPQLEYSGYFNPTKSHPIWKNVGTDDTNVTVTALVSIVPGSLPAAGACAATIVAKQVSYDTARDSEAALTTKVPSQGSDGQPLTWGKSLSDGIQIFTAAGNTGSQDFGAATAGGWLTVHCLAFTGTSCTIKLQDSTNNSTFADVDATAQTVVTGVSHVRIPLASTVNVDRYVRANLAGTFTSAQLLIVFAENPIEV